MTFRNIQRVEVVKVSFDLAVVFDDIAHRNKDVVNALAHQSDGMKMSGPRPAAGDRHIDTVAFGAGGFDNRLQLLIGLLD
jgi:hypothetical protein